MHSKLFSGLAFTAAVSIAGAASAQTTITKITATLGASPTTTFVGKCPAVITFKGEIIVKGKFAPLGKPIQIGYTFLRSDGATGPIKYYDITAPNTTVVEDTWTLGGAAMPNYSGWQQLKAWPTAHLGFAYAFSPKAHFTVHCK